MVFDRYIPLFLLDNTNEATNLFKSNECCQFVMYCMTLLLMTNTQNKNSIEIQEKSFEFHIDCLMYALVSNR